MTFNEVNATKQFFVAQYRKNEIPEELRLLQVYTEVFETIKAFKAIPFRPVLMYELLLTYAKVKGYPNIVGLLKDNNISRKTFQNMEDRWLNYFQMREFMLQPTK